MNILIYTINDFCFRCGGLVVQYQLCYVLESLGVNVKIRAPNKIQNSIFNNYYNDDNDLDFEKTIVIYGETIEGNPMNAKYVIRWILAPLGFIVGPEIANTWGKNDLVYYFNTETKFSLQPEKIGSIYKLLNVIYINPYAKNINSNPRRGVCHTFRKSAEIHGKVKYIHPIDSFEITREHTQMQCIALFNKFKTFVSYDSLTFLNVIAALCGCISIVYKVKGLNKQEWIMTTAASNFFKFKGHTNLFGIAYGLEDIPFAVNTLHLAPQQWKNILNYSKEKIVLPFVNDINNYQNMINTIQNNFY
jgi:hypothetical protein